MKTTQPVFWNKWMKNGRRPARPPMRFTECKKLVLKDSVTTGSRYGNGNVLILLELFNYLNILFFKNLNFRTGLQCSNDGDDYLSQNKRF